MPVMTSTLGRCVARMTCIPAARAFCARRATETSTSPLGGNRRSANSSTTITMNGSFSGRGASPSSLPFSAGMASVNPLKSFERTTLAFGFLMTPRATLSAHPLYVPMLRVPASANIW